MRLLRARLGRIEDVARDEFQRIDAGDLPRMNQRTFFSIGAITAGYADSFRRALGDST